MPQSLSQALEKNKEILGSDYQELGKTVGEGFFGHRKIFLSYDNKNGWDVVQLNFFARLLRKIFGLYKSTHLKTVVRALEELKEKNIDRNEKLEKRVESIWEKRYLITLGNSDTSCAQIFCFPEKHGKKRYRETIGSFIKHHYRPGDVVLVEGVVAGKSIKPHDHQATFSLPDDIEIQGWEPEDFHELTGGIFAESDKMIERLHTLFKNWEGYVPKTDDFSEKELALLEKQIRAYANEFKELAVYFKVDIEAFSKTQKGKIDDVDFYQIFYNIFLKLKKKEFDRESYKATIIYFLLPLEQKAEKIRYERMSESEINAALSTIRKRTHSLCQQIDKCIREGKRIFVIAGAAHLVCCPGRLKAEDVAEIKSTLEKYKFVVLAKRDFYSKSLQALNPDLKTLS